MTVRYWRVLAPRSCSALSRGPVAEDFSQGSSARETRIGGLELIGGWVSWKAIGPRGIQPCEAG